MRKNVLKLMKRALQNRSKKIGDLDYRALIVNNSRDSEKAIRFMERLRLAYRIQYLAGINTGEMKLPAVHLAYGRTFQGLDAIKYYGKTAFGPWPGEF